MKKYIVILLACICGVSCSRYEDDIFPEGRMEKLATECDNLLVSADNGWKVLYYPNPEKFGGFTLAMKFTASGKSDGKGTVVVYGDEKQFGSEGTKGYSSHYSVSLKQGVDLTFDTYNNIISYLSDPENVRGYGTGYEGDNEFIYVSTSAAKDSIRFKGKKRGGNIIFIKLNESPVDYMTKANQSLSSYAADPYYFKEVEFPNGKKMTLVDCNNFVIRAARPIVEEEGAFEDDYVLPFGFDDQGMNLYHPLNYGEYSISSFVNKGSQYYAKLADGQELLLKGVVRPSQTLSQAVYFFDKNADSDLRVSTASPDIEEMIDAYKKAFEESVESTPALKDKAFVFYDMRFVKNMNVDINKGETRESVTYPDAFISTAFSVKENKLYIYEDMSCKFEQATEDEITFSFNRFSSSGLKPIFSFLDKRINNATIVVVPSADYSSSVLVSTVDQQWIQLN